MAWREERHSYVEVSAAETNRKNRMTAFGKPRISPCMCKALKITGITLAVLVVLALILLFVVLPLSFMLSIEFQRFAMFPNIVQPSDPEYNNFAKYGARGTRNLYVSVVDSLTNSTISLGVWHVLPESLIADSEATTNYNFDEALASGEHPVIIYFHGNSGTRIAPLNTYLVLRKFFHVIAFDYRHYGDSSPALLTEPAVVDDSVQLYKWVRAKTTADIYVWGHSLGTALSTHTVKMLSKQSIVPLGLILEAPFTTMREELPLHPLGKIFAWLPYFTATFLDPLDENGFHFRTTTNILDVNCPILIVNAEDDSIIPYYLGEKLAKVARENRNVAVQGNVTYYMFEAHLRYNHLDVSQDPRIPDYVDKFMQECQAFFGTAKQSSSS